MSGEEGEKEGRTILVVVLPVPFVSVHRFFHERLYIYTNGSQMYLIILLYCVRTCVWLQTFASNRYMN